MATLLSLHSHTHACTQPIHTLALGIGKKLSIFMLILAISLNYRTFFFVIDTYYYSHKYRTASAIPNVEVMFTFFFYIFEVRFKG